MSSGKSRMASCAGGHQPVPMPRKAKTLSDDPAARRLHLTRLALGYEWQNEFAQGAGLTPNRYNPWETGARPLTIGGAKLLCDRYGLTFDWLFHGIPDALPHALVIKLIALGALTRPPLASRG